MGLQKVHGNSTKKLIKKFNKTNTYEIEVLNARGGSTTWISMSITILALLGLYV
jgi:hypothetical protein